MAHKIALMNNKGGVGKTTLTVNLGAALTAISEKNNRVLIVDMDPQGNASSYLLKAQVDRAEEDLERDLGQLLKDPGHSIKDLIYTYQYYTEEKAGKNGKPQHAPRVDADDEAEEKNFAWHDYPKLKVLPGPESLRFDFESDSLLAGLDRDILKNALAAVEDEFDYILIDCPPSLNKLSQLGLLAADYLIIPIKPGEFEIIGMKAMLDVVEKFGTEHKHELPYKVVLNLYRNNSKKHGEYFISLTSLLGELFANTAINLAEEITGSIKNNLPVIFTNKSVVKKDFVALGKELAQDLRRMEATNA